MDQFQVRMHVGFRRSPLSAILDPIAIVAMRSPPLAEADSRGALACFPLFLVPHAEVLPVPARVMIHARLALGSDSQGLRGARHGHV